MARSLILVAGYPKSGTTWVRLVFETLRRGRAISINDMDGSYYGARRRMLFDEFAPANAGDLLAEEIDDLLPDIFRTLSDQPAGPHILKVHDKAHITNSGAWLFPPESVRAAIYLTRHPFDVAASYAHHLGITARDVIAIMRREEIARRPPVHLPLYLNERWGSWSGNINSWLDAAPYKIVPVRYEDVFANPVAAFTRLTKAAEIFANDAQISRACEVARFESLRNEERVAGFIERPRSSPVFFRAGRPSSWHGILDDESRAKLMEDHGDAMARLGYDADGNANPAPDWFHQHAIA